MRNIKTVDLICPVEMALILIPAHVEIPAKLFPVSNINNSEFIFARLNLHDLHINSLYISPSFLSTDRTLAIFSLKIYVTWTRYK